MKEYDVANVSPNAASDQAEPDHRPAVVKAALLASGSFATAIGTLLAVAGEWGTPDETVRYAITAIGIITALALGIAAAYVWQRR
ncbi:hypothetical protein [Actinoplanes sp. NPDC051859]|uniref:hypothetical protein n=1 Tax=Actinoplanes sp. NPDC051859 TaxID=3363909 RepID=UPI0037A0D647